MRLRTLGALDLRSSDGREQRGLLAQPKRIALLAYLALAAPRGFQRRDTLIALFWPEHDEEHARNSLSQSVHVLRHALGAQALVSRNGDAVSLDWSDSWCDVVAFEEAVDAGRFTDAVELYRGDLLEGFHISGAPEFERWLAAERERLARRYMGALEQLAAEREAAGDFSGAVIWWRRLAARDPYSSRVTLRLMRALAAAGDPASAVQQARVHEALLREELQVAPNPDVAALVRQLQATSTDEARSTDARVSTPTLSDRSLPVSRKEPSGDRRRRRRQITVAMALLALGAAVAGVLAFKREDPRIRSLAILPLANLSRDSADQIFAEGMHDELILQTGRYPELAITARTSVLKYRGTTKSAPEIARELHVGGIVEGAITRQQGRVRMNVALVDGLSGRQIWRESYTRDLQDVLELQREVAEAIARELRVATAPVSRARRLLGGPRDSAPGELYLVQLYLFGRAHELSRSLVGLQTAKQYYQSAIQRDSTFALGYAGLAQVYELMAFYHFASAGPAVDSARTMARRAVTLDSTLPEAHTAVALTLADAHDFDGAEREFKRAIALGPSNAQAHYWYSMLLVALGRGNEALQEAERGLSLDPASPRGALGMKRSAEYLIAGTHSYRKEPVTKRRPILSLEPSEPWARAHNAADLAEEGRCAEARADVLHARQLAPGANIRMMWFVAMVEWLCGNRGGARALLDTMERSPDAHEQATAIAALHTRFGEKDSAFVWLDRQQPWMMIHLAFLSADRFLDSLRADPRFPPLLRRVGIRK